MGWNVRSLAYCCGGAGRARRWLSSRWTVLGLVAVVAASVLSASVTRRVVAGAGCGSIGYAYDAAGRLAGVTDQGGRTVRYRYDEVGNILGVDNLGTPDLSVLSFSPTRAAPETEVTVSGGCFADEPADNTVSFNGVPAQVTSANA